MKESNNNGRHLDRYSWAHCSEKEADDDGTERDEKRLGKAQRRNGAGSVYVARWERVFGGIIVGLSSWFVSKKPLNTLDTLELRGGFVVVFVVPTICLTFAYSTVVFGLWSCTPIQWRCGVWQTN